MNANDAHAAERVQINNEQTPKTKILHSSMNVDNSMQWPKTAESSWSKDDVHMRGASTPKHTPKADSSQLVRSRNEANSEFSITNPFESENTIDSLLQPSFSPSVFASASHKTPLGNAANVSAATSPPEAFWSIEHIAVLKPTEFDLSRLHEQENFVQLDAASELKAQKAIDQFFQDKIKVPSPWTPAAGQRQQQQQPHFLALISPCSWKKQRTLQTAKTASSSSFSSNNRSLFSTDRKKPPAEANGAVGKSTKTTTTAAQTEWSIPADIDLSAIVRQFSQPTASSLQHNDGNDSLGNSSLRRRLFLQDKAEPTDGLKSPPLATPAALSSDSSAETHQLAAKHHLMMTPVTSSSNKDCSFSFTPVSGERMHDLGTPRLRGTLFPTSSSHACLTSPLACPPIADVSMDDKSGSDDASFRSCPGVGSPHDTAHDLLALAVPCKLFAAPDDIRESNDDGLASARGYESTGFVSPAKLDKSAACSSPGLSPIK